MANPYESLTVIFQRLAQLDHAMTFLQWDQLVMMPPAGNDARARAMAELAALRHEMLTAPHVSELLPEAKAQALDADVNRSLDEMQRVWQQAACIPPSLVKAKSLAGSACEHAWRTQRLENDWKGFLNNFQEVVRLSREEAQARMAAAPDRFTTPYDALVDLYCAGDDSRFIQHVFAELKRALPALLQEALGKQPTVGVGLTGNYPVAAQEGLNRRLMSCLGFDFSAGRLDVSMHPFSTGCRGDHRITTRFRESDFADALMATAHETGHASYESGLPRTWEGLPAGRARSMSIHESQSLLFEKHLFLSRAFIGFFTDAVHEFLPDAVRFGAEDIWSAGVRVRPGLIRIEADEVTYPLHVIMRFEIEKALIDRQAEAADIPEMWDEKMRAYLGISTKGDYRDGCLQDIHWTDGSFGYFPAYTLGALNAAQLFAAIRREHPDWRDHLRKGEVAFVRGWLEENVWRHGCLKDAQDIMREATGEETRPTAFLAHLRARYIDSAE